MLQSFPIYIQGKRLHPHITDARCIYHKMPQNINSTRIKMTLELRSEDLTGSRRRHLRDITVQHTLTCVTQILAQLSPRTLLCGYRLFRQRR